MENTLKIKVFRKSTLFLKYFRNESSDLYEILCGGQFLFWNLSFKFQKDPSINSRARVVNARIRDIMCAHAFTTRAHAFMHVS